jgi:2'-5' RNA ligase
MTRRVNDDTFVGRLVSPPENTVIGIVVPVPEPWAQLLVDWRAKVGDPQASLVPPHVTLLPPTEVAVTERPAITAHLEEVARCHPPFDMHLAGTGTFSPVSEVVFVAVARGIGSCELIANDVRRGPLARALSFPYHPHVTVAHLDDDDLLDRAFAELASFDCSFSVDAFHLYVHEPGLGWKATRDYGLTGPVH